MRLTNSLLLVFSSATLISCGGPPTPAPVGSTSPFPIDAAASAWKQGSHSVSITATDSSNNTYTLNYSTTPGGASTFQGGAASTATTSSLLKKNGVLISSSSGTDYFQLSPFKPLGHVDATTNYATVVTSWTQLPATATVGQSGAFSTDTEYTSVGAIGTKGSVVDTATTTWSLEADTASTAWFCLNQTVVYTASTPTLTESECYKLDTSGNVLAVKITQSQGGVVLAFH